MYVPSAAVIVDPPIPPSIEVTDTQTPATSDPPTAALTVPVILAAKANSALTPVAGDNTDVETVDAPDTDGAPEGVLLYHCVT